MAEFVFNLSENTLTERLNLVRAQSQNQTLTPILQTLIETANLRGNERHDLLDQVLNVTSWLMEKFLVTEPTSNIILLYHSMDKIIANISKYGLSRSLVKDMFIYIA